jgi:hypothetical protein
MKMASFYTLIVSKHKSLTLLITVLCLAELFISTPSSPAHLDPAQEESEFFVRADFNIPVEQVEAKLLYFLNLGLQDLDISFGAAFFLNIDKSHGMRMIDDPYSNRYGRLSLDDIKNRVAVKKELFVICAAGKLLHLF